MFYLLQDGSTVNTILETKKQDGPKDSPKTAKKQPDLRKENVPSLIDATRHLSM